MLHQPPPSLFTEQRAAQIEGRYAFSMRRRPKRAQELAELLTALPREEALGLRYCYAFMPVTDLVSLDAQTILAFVRHALKVRAEVPYTHDIPAELYLNYVMFYRVNNETVEDCRGRMYEEIRPRIQGMDITGAALEINHWCYEKATYQLSDARTLSPLGVMRAAAGRCGEESVLAVSALRSAGIPARQCYAPKWAHCDDNHAWVEAYAGGGWRYLGACEPEPELCRGWFTSAASRAMLVHSRAFSDMTGGEPVASRSAVCCTINNTPAYAQCRELKIRVTRGGEPAKGIQVRAELMNYGELSPICTLQTDESGQARFICGLGDIWLHAHDGTRFIGQKVDVRECGAVTIDFLKATGAEDCPEGSFDFDMIPPQGKPASAPAPAPEIRQAHERRLAQDTRVREAYQASFFTPDTARAWCGQRGLDAEAFVRALVGARGNDAQIRQFLETPGFSAGEKAELLEALTPKDFIDCQAQTLVSILRQSLPYREAFPKDIYQSCILNPRAAHEPMRDVRGDLRRLLEGAGETIQGPPDVLRITTQRVTPMDDSGYEDLAADPRGVLYYGVATSHSMDVLFVSACRALGFPARLNPATGEKEYWQDGRFHVLAAPAERATGSAALQITLESGRPLQYGVHFTLARLDSGVFETLRYPADATQTGVFAQTLAPGLYRALCASRQIDGAILARACVFRLRTGEDKAVTMTPRADCILQRLVSAPLPAVPIGAQSLKDRIGASYALAAFVEPGAEPTVHFLNELMDNRDALKAEGIPVVLLNPSDAAAQDALVQRVCSALENVQAVCCTDESTPARVRAAMRVGDERLPLSVAVAPNAVGLFAFANYNVGTVDSLLQIIRAHRGMCGKTR